MIVGGYSVVYADGWTEQKNTGAASVYYCTHQIRFPAREIL